jgi:hypothetical protein
MIRRALLVMRPTTLVAAILFAGSVGGVVHAQSAHWSYQPVVRPVPPVVTEQGWRAPLDTFVLAAMTANGLAPSPPAERAAWLRRVSLDLTGLPPTLRELEAFLADAAIADVAARERVVAQLLHSAAYAERWTQWWLDLARYADSQGYEKDELRRTMWRYRDQVLGAFAAGQPFDQFTIEQLAGDLLPDATDAQQLATAFHRQTMTNTEGGTDDEEFRVAAVVDRVDTTLSVWMGSTLGCAQCHDHKYDPFSQREFFQLFAFFDQTEDFDQPNDAPTLRVPTEQQRAATKVIDLELTALRARMVADDVAVAKWGEAVRQQQRAFRAAAPAGSEWHVLGPVPAASFREAHRTAFAPERDGVRLDEVQDGLSWRAEPGYADGRVHGWQGDNSAFYLHRTIAAADAAPALLSLGSDDAIKVWWNGAEILAKEVGRPAAPDQEVLPIELRRGTNTVLLKITNGGGPGGFCFDLRAVDGGGELERVLAIEPGACDAKDHEVLRREFLARAPELAAVRTRIAELERELDAQRGPAVPVLRDLPPDKRRTTRLHRRGSFLDQTDVVTPDVPKVWPGLPADAPRNRLGFARWLVANHNPLTARVLVNRIWSELFGTGLVPTLEDFGSQGDRPSHPELLDWLAAEFMSSGWSLRHLLQTIVLSATYGQSSVQTAHHGEVDPDNRCLARGPSLRLPAEMVRDQALAVSGLLSAKLGGPSVMPQQPDGVWLQIYSGEKWVAAANEDRYRRSLYTFWRRTSPHPAMLLFDAQSRESCVLRRRSTNTPLQALVLWNDPQFVDAARSLAVEMVFGAECVGRDDAARVRWLWRRCLLREPTTSEAAKLAALLADEQRRFRAEPQTAAAFFAPGPGSQEVALAPWVVVAGVVMALDEFVSKR